MALLGACGGGGQSDTTAPATTTSTTTTTTGSGSGTPAAPVPVTARLSGVAALGAPMAGARLQVVDATGTLVGSTTTSLADGSYRLDLSPAVGPLMLQVAGTDAAGQPTVLHSAVSTLAASAVANVTPLSEATLAVALGVEPRVVFAAAKANPASLAALGSLGAASDFVKTLVKTNLADAKITNVSKLDLLADGSFSATKTGVDLALETLTLGYGQNAKGGTQLQLSNKLSGVPAEVTVDLDTARTELNKTTGGAPANAITSVLKATTSPTAMITTLVLLDDLVAAVNKVIAEGGTADSAPVTALLTKYTQNNGNRAGALAARMAGWAASKMQLGRLQVTGCADDVVAKTGCVKVAVAARLTDASGAQADSFIDAVSYEAKPVPKWQLVGNDQAVGVSVNSLAWRALGADGAAATSAATGAAIPTRLGVQFKVGGRATRATVQTPGGYALTQLPCAPGTTLCIAATSSVGTVAYTGALADDTVFSALSAWLGAADVALGARYKVSVFAADGTSVIRNPVLRSSFTTVPDAGRFPVLDDVSASQPLSGTTLLSASTLAWSNWAAKNPDLRLVFVRSVITDSTGQATVLDQNPTTWQSTSLDLAAPVVPADIAGLTLWLAAVDGTGRWYCTSYRLL